MNIRKKLHRWLVQTLPLAALGAFTLLISGCGPDEWIVWAPDGTHGVINGSQRIDPAGNLLGAITAEKEHVVAWLPDSRRVLVVRRVPAQDWSEYAALLGEERALAVAQAGAEMARLIREYQGALDAFDESAAFKIWKENLDAHSVGVETVMYCLKVTRPGLLDPMLDAVAKKQNAQEKEDPVVDTDKTVETGAHLLEQIGVPDIHELHLRSAVVSGDSGDQMLFRSADGFASVAVSPNSRAVAFVRQEGSHEEGSDSGLYVMALEAGAQAVLVAKGAEFAAWSPDGQELAYTKSEVRRASKNGFILGAIAHRRVCATDGSIIAEPEAGEDVAGLVLPEYPARLAWLSDGRILFAGAKFSLPATTQNLPERLTLFALRLNPEASMEQLIPESVPARLTQRVNYFTVSPDGKNVAVLGKAGAVSVLTLATKNFATFQDSIPQFEKKNDDDSILVPAWRTADELTWLVPAGDRAGSSHRGEVVIASLSGGRRAISKSWPDSASLPPLEK